MNLAFLLLLLGSLCSLHLHARLTSSSKVKNAVTDSINKPFPRRLQYSEDESRYMVWDFSENLSPRKVVGVRADEMFGSSVSIWDQYMVVGASGDRSREFASGAVYIYSKEINSDGSYYWKFVEVLEPWDGAEGDSFGSAVDLHLYTLVVGASMHNGRGQDAGAAYIYECYNNNEHHHDEHHPEEEEEEDMQRRWYLAAELQPEEGRPQDYFGSAVATQGNYTAVAAYGNDHVATFSGAVYVWRKTWLLLDPQHPWEWVYDEMLTPSDGQRYDFFGASLAIYDNRLVVGASGVDDDVLYKVGAVYVYHNTYDDSATDGMSFQLLSKLTPGSLGVTYENFGQSVSLWEDNLVVGAPNAEALGVAGAGAFYSFGFDKYSNPYFIEKVLPQQPSQDARCGYSVDLFQDLAAMGCPNSSGHGSVYFYTEVSPLTTPSTKNIHWLYESQKQVADVWSPGDLFGHSVSVYDDTVAVGAHKALASVGAAYLYVGKKKVYQDMFANETDDDVDASGEEEAEQTEEGDDVMEGIEEMLVAFEESHPRETKALVFAMFVLVLMGVTVMDRRRRFGGHDGGGQSGSPTRASYELAAMESSHDSGSQASSSVTSGGDAAWGVSNPPPPVHDRPTYSPMSTVGDSGGAGSGGVAPAPSQRVRDLAAAGLLARPVQKYSPVAAPPAAASSSSDFSSSSPYSFSNRPESGQ